jgi:transposase InsO family protein
VLFFISLATRRIEYVACTPNPDGRWVAQQARNLIMQFGDEHPFRFVIHDRDTKFSHAFDELFRSEGVKVIRTPIQAPNANAFAERWVRSVRTECLDQILILGRRHLEHVLRIYRCHYNEHRPHRALQLTPPNGRDPTPLNTTGWPTPPRPARRAHPRIRGRLSLRTLRVLAALWCSAAAAVPDADRALISQSDV